MARYLSSFTFLILAGCMGMPGPEGDKGVSLVSNNPFGVEPPPPAATKAAYAPADQKVSERVYKVGMDIIEANKQISVRPHFATIGLEQVEIFHVGTSLVYVTEGLVKQCRSNADLAALLSMELAKMVAEREALASNELRNPEKLPPIQMPAGNPLGGREGDMTTLAELGRFEKANPKLQPRLVRPDPRKLARGYLEKAGFQAGDLDGVQPLLQAAEQNVALERHFKGVMPQSPWTP